MSLFSKIKGLSYEMEEYLYELKSVTSDIDHERVSFLTREYEKDLADFLDLSKGDLKSLSLEQKEEILELREKYEMVQQNLIEFKNESNLAKEQSSPYSDIFEELIVAMLGKPKAKTKKYRIMKDTLISDFLFRKEDLKVLSKLEKKYNLKKIGLKDRIWDIAEKMYNFRPF